MASNHKPRETSPLLGRAARQDSGLDQSDPQLATVGESDLTVSAPSPPSSQDPEGQKHRSSAPDDEHDTNPSDGPSSAILTKLKYLLPAVGIGIFLAAADSTLIVSCYTSIGNDLDALNRTSWVATAYFLSLTSFQPLYGKLSDIFGRKSCLLFAYMIFMIGSLACGLSSSMELLIAGRVVQGIGGGGMTTVVNILISDIVPLKDRGLWQGFLNVIYATGSTSGAAVGGLLADTVGWRWAFLGQVPISAISILAVGVVLKMPARKEAVETWKTKLNRIDFMGAAALIVAVTVLLLGLDRGSNVSWRIAASYGPLSASLIFFAAFVLVETRFAKEPFAPGHVIFGTNTFGGYLCLFFSSFTWTAVLYYVPLFYQAVDAVGASGAAIRLLPSILSSVSGSLFGGFLMRRTGKYYWLTVMGYISLTFGTVLILLFQGFVANSSIVISAGLAFGAFGNGIGLTTCLIAVIANVTKEEQAVATAGVYLFRSLAASVGVSVTSAIVQQMLRVDLKRALGSGRSAEKIEVAVRKSLEYIKTLDPDTQMIVRDAYGDAVRKAFGVLALVSCGALLSSFWLRETRLGA